MSDIGLVSVIVPTYNRARQCRLSVESVLNQSYSNVEVLVIDDGSTDDTEAEISNLDSRVRYIKQENGGVTVARNTGLRAATGDFIAFLDSDDSWMAWKLEAQLAVLRDYPEIGMVWSDLVAVDENGKELFPRYLRRMYHAYNLVSFDQLFQEQAASSWLANHGSDENRDTIVYDGDIYRWMFLGSLVHTSTVLMTRERQRQVGLFDESLTKTGEDYDYHFRTCSFGPVALLDTPSIYYQVGASDQLTAPELSRWMAVNNLRTIKKAWEHDSNRFLLPADLVKKRWSNAYNWVGVEEFWEDRRASRRAFSNSVKWWPFNVSSLIYLGLTLFPLRWNQSLRSFKRWLSQMSSSA